MIYYNYPPKYYPLRSSYLPQNSFLASKHLSENLQNNHIQNDYNSNRKGYVTNKQNSDFKENKTDKQANTSFDSFNPNAIFEIFGIKLYFDDILLICLIFFLYTEGVEDKYLFIALILLLLS